MSPTPPPLNGERIAQLRRERGLTQEMLAEAVGVDTGTIARWERGAQQIRPRNEAALAAALGIGLGEVDAPSKRELRSVEFVSWLADNSDQSFESIYQSVCAAADQIGRESTSAKHASAYARGSIDRDQLAEAVAGYYGKPPEPYRYYSAVVDGKPIQTTILTTDGWDNAAVALGSDGERSALVEAPNGSVSAVSNHVVEAATRRLADVEVAGRVLTNNPTYRLMSVDVAGGAMSTTFAVADFADYALRAGLMEKELIDQVAGVHPAGSPMPLREALLPDAASMIDVGSRHCMGGPVALVAIARPETDERPSDYALLVQVRGKQVIDIPGKISTIPKGWHQPVGEPARQTRLGMTLLRELEEELLGRADLEQLSEAARRTAAPMHSQHRPDAMAALLANPDSFSVWCTGFGLNLLSGTFEVPCLIVIDDETWWEQWGHLIIGNWETAAIETYSTSDAGSLAALAHDRRWCNEGLFAYLQGIRLLVELGGLRQLLDLKPRI